MKKMVIAVRNVKRVLIAILFGAVILGGYVGGQIREVSMRWISRTYEDGHIYLDVSPAREYILCGERGAVFFVSMNDFYRTVKTLDFDKQFLPEIYVQAGKKGRIRFFDIESLFVPTAPVKIAEGVTWSGDLYSFTFDFGTEHPEMYGGLSVFPNEDQETFFDYVNNHLPQDSLYVRETENGAYTATVCAYQIETTYSGTRQYQVVQYQVTQNEKTLHIRMEYEFPDTMREPTDTPAWLVPDVYPAYIELYGKENDVMYCIILDSFDFEPEIDWLLSFGVEQYVLPQELAELKTVNAKIFPPEIFTK